MLGSMGWGTFFFDANNDGAPPVETSMSLNFQEMELITRERVFEGF